MANTDFSYRLARARSGNMRIVRYLDDAETVAEIHNAESRNTYTVTLSSCTCEDFTKRKTFGRSLIRFLFGRGFKPAPCKHILFLMLSKEQYDPLCVEVCGDRYPVNSDDLVPIYNRIYSSGPTGPGFCNLYYYSVCGHIHGVSDRTGKPTCRKKTISVAATSAGEAMQLAEEAGVMPPYSSVKLHSAPPTVNQLNYIHSLHIPYPALINRDDIHALLTRYQEQDFEIAPKGLFTIATDLRIVVSYFSSPSQLCAYIWNRLPEDRRPAFYCYAVYCKECCLPIGAAPLPYTHPAFTSFAPDDKYYDYVRRHDGVYNITKRPKIYGIAVEHLRACNLIF